MTKWDFFYEYSFTRSLFRNSKARFRTHAEEEQFCSVQISSKESSFEVKRREREREKNLNLFLRTLVLILALHLL